MFSETKFLPPRIRSTHVSRPDLVDRVARNDHQPLTLVVGPAGTGKSSVLAEWYLHADDGSVGWLCADRNDADPTRFWRAFIVAVQTVDPKFGVDAADAMTLDGVVTADALESLLVDDGMLSRRIRLVIDDFQLVSAEAVLQLRQLLERGLSHVRLLIGSRNEPALGLHRLRLQDDICELRETELRLDLGQTHELISKIGLDPARIDLPLLHSRTEGWAAGIHLAALSALGSRDAAASLRTLGGNNQSIAGYLAAEVLANQPDRIRRFLEDTCVVDELDEQMCDALTSRVERSLGAEIPTLTEIESANLFLSRVDEAGTLFRYHRLFVDLLRDQLRAREPGRFREQHRLAAEMFMRQSNISGAIDHFWAAGERDLAARVINENLLAVLYSGVGLPPIDLHVDLSEHDPRNVVGEASGYAAALLIQGRNAEALAILDQVDRYATSVSMVDRMHLHCLWIPAKLSVGDSTGAAQAADELIQLVANGAVPADEWVTVAIPLGIKAYSWEGNFARVDQLVDLMRPTANPDLERADLASSVAFAHYEEGLLAEALRTAEAAHGHASASGIDDGGIDLVARSVLGCALLETADFEAASEHLSVVLATPRTDRIPTFVLASLGRARLMRAEGQFDAALRTIAAARSLLLSPVPTTISNRLDEMEISLRLDLGDMARTTQLAARLIPGWRADAMKTWIAIAVGQYEEACAMIDKITDEASTPRRRLNVALMRAHIAVRCNRLTMEDRVVEVLQLAETTGSVLRIAEAGTEVLQEVGRVARRRPRSDFVERLLAARPLLRPTSQVAPPYKVDELSAREVVVLQYLATSMSYQEIASALYLSINTVKTHVKNVLRKLSVSSRAEAVRRATELHYF